MPWTLIYSKRLSWSLCSLPLLWRTLALLSVPRGCLWWDLAVLLPPCCLFFKVAHRDHLLILLSRALVVLRHKSHTCLHLCHSLDIRLVWIGCCRYPKAFFRRAELNMYHSDSWESQGGVPCSLKIIVFSTENKQSPQLAMTLFLSKQSWALFLGPSCARTQYEVWHGSSLHYSSVVF